MKFLLKLDKEDLKLTHYELETILKIKIPKEKTEVIVNSSFKNIKRLSLVKRAFELRKNKKTGEVKRVEIPLDKWENISLRPGFKPVSLKPKLARTLVNITGAKGKDKIIDPFCGTGGILIEAGKIGLKSVGYDIDPMMIKFTKANLKHYNLSEGKKGQFVKLERRNSLELNKKYNFIVTDLPYGKNTKQKNYDKIIQDFINLLPNILRKKAVVVIPNNVKIKIPEKIKLEKEFIHYIHKSMSKRILVFIKA